MKTYKRVYEKICSKKNIFQAYEKAKKGKSKKPSVLKFENNLDENLRQLQKELIDIIYNPSSLKRFIVRDPKTRTIHASAFRDRIVHHALLNVIGPIFEKSFIQDSYASQLNKGTHPAIERFTSFMRKASCNGRKVRSGGGRSANSVTGYVLKSDIKHYFDSVDHEILLNIIKRKIKDENTIWLIKQILNNFENFKKGKGMPLGNYTSQFFANVYLNELDYFVKHYLKAKYYIRYVDDFVILHKSKKRLEYYRERISKFINLLKLELHPDKSSIIPLKSGVTFLGYRIFYYHKLLRKRNLRSFQRKFDKMLETYKEDKVSKEKLIIQLQGWFGYAKWANTYNLRKNILDRINKAESEKNL